MGYGTFVKLKSSFCTAALVVGLLGVAQTASAETISMGFDLISQSPTSRNIQAAPQFQVSVSDVLGQSSLALFTFSNVGPIASSICDIYFDDGTPRSLMEIADIYNTSGVNFSSGASPGNLPGGEGVDFHVTNKLLAADANSPRTQQNGINPGEQLGVLVTLLSGATFDTIKESLTGGKPLRVGIHVQGFSDGSSASYVSRPPAGGSQPPPPQPAAAPLPGPVWAGLVLIGGLGLHRLRQRKLALA